MMPSVRGKPLVFAMAFGFLYQFSPGKVCEWLAKVKQVTLIRAGKW